MPPPLAARLAIDDLAKEAIETGGANDSSVPSSPLSSLSFAGSAALSRLGGPAPGISIAGLKTAPSIAARSPRPPALLRGGGAPPRFVTLCSDFGRPHLQSPKRLALMSSR